jgi:hypothetical protein
MKKISKYNAGDIVICYSNEDHYDDCLNESNLPFPKIGRSYKISSIDLEYVFIEFDIEDRRIGYPIRYENSPDTYLKHDIKIAYVDRFFINHKEYRKLKLKKLREYNGD